MLDYLKMADDARDVEIGHAANRAPVLHGAKRNPSRVKRKRLTKKNVRAQLRGRANTQPAARSRRTPEKNMKRKKSRRRRSAAQIAATKKLVARNRKRAKAPAAAAPRRRRARRAAKVKVRRRGKRTTVTIGSPRRRRRRARAAAPAARARRYRRPRRGALRRVSVRKRGKRTTISTTSYAPRRRRRRARAPLAAAPRRRRRRARAAAPAQARRRRRRRASAPRAMARRRRTSRRRRGAAMENPMTGVELFIGAFTGLLGFGTADIVDRLLATHALVTGTTASSTAGVMVSTDTPPTTGSYANLFNPTAICAPMNATRWLVGLGIAATPIVIAHFVSAPVGRSSLQFFGFGAGMRILGKGMTDMVAALTSKNATGMRLFEGEQRAQALKSGNTSYQTQVVNGAGLGRPRVQVLTAKKTCGSCGSSAGVGCCTAAANQPAQVPPPAPVQAPAPGTTPGTIRGVPQLAAAPQPQRSKYRWGERQYDQVG